MSNKRIVFSSPCVAELLDWDMPRPAAGQVVVKLMRSSISAGTERANLTGVAQVTIGTETVPFPRYAGYSSAGEVIAVGEGVSRVKIGDRVACSWSSHMKYCLMNEENVHPLGEIGYDAGALVHIATFPMAALRKCRIEMGESVIVMGQGVLGQIAVQLARAAGAVPIIAVDPVEEKRASALALGADHALDPFDPDFVKTVKRLTGGGAKVAIEVTGLGSGLDMVLDCMARFGRVALLGCTRDSNFTIDYYRKVHGPGITLVGAHTVARPKQESHEGWWTEKDDALALIRLVEGGRLDLSSLIEEVQSPVSAPEVYQRLAAGGGFPVVQYDWTMIDD